MERGHRRCVCGRSARFPLCDGAHEDAGWRCDARRVGLVVAAAHHLESLGERLAAELGGVLARPGDRGLEATRLIALTDGLDVDLLRPVLAAVRADARLAVAVGVPAGALGGALPGFTVTEVDGDDAGLWRAVLRAVDGEGRPPAGRLRRGFLSHAVADEVRLQGAVDWLRTWMGAELFVCADSIGAGADWRASIEGGLRGAEVFVLLASPTSVASTWCAYEAGLASALGLETRVILLDSVGPPPWLAHVQADDLPRTLRRKPWMSASEALVDALLRALADPVDG